MDQHLSERSRARFGLVGCAVLLIAAAGAAVAVVPPSGGSTRLHATFERSGQGLDPGRSTVQVRGVPVGTVERVDLDRAGRASVRFRIDDTVRVPATASARIEPLSLFGPKDLALDLHDGRGPYLHDGATVQRTSGTPEPADLADPARRLVRAIDPDDLTTLLHSLASGLASQGPALHRTIGNTAAVIDASHRNRTVLQNLIRDLDGLSGPLSPRGGTWTAFTRDFNDLAPLAHRHPDQISRLLDESSRLTTRLGGFLTAHGGNVGQIIDTTGRVSSTLTARQHQIPVLLYALPRFFEILSEAIRAPGPKGTLLAQALSPLPLDICVLIIDICPVSRPQP